MTVLGKRTRATAQLSAEPADLPARSKRRTKSSPRHKEVEAGFQIHQDHEENPAHFHAVDTENDAAAKAQTHNKRVVLSPTKPNTAKKGPAEQQESKSCEEVSTPKTPRHRDALSKQSPFTPRHRVRIGGAPLTPRTPRTPRTPLELSKPTVASRSVYQKAKKCFSGNADDDGQQRLVVGRDSEREELKSFISKRLASGSGGALYVSGPPGTGKSALLNEVSQEIQLPATAKSAYLNCMSVKTVSDVYTILLSELGISDNIFDTRQRTKLQDALVNKQTTCHYVIILDEIDALLDIDVNVLYSLFEWALNQSSRLILVGIANALDLTDRFLPGLRSRGLKPQLLPFLPYTAAEIASVLTARSRSLLEQSSQAPESFTPFLMPPAIQLIAKKVSAQTGDLRKAFDIARKTIDVVEAEIKTKMQKDAEDSPSGSPTKLPLAENTNLSSPRSPSQALDSPPKVERASFAQLTPMTAPRATLSHVVRVTSAAFNHGTKERLQTLNLQQKAVLCALAALEQRGQQTQSQETSNIEMLSRPQTGLLPSPSATPSKKRAKGILRTPSKRDSRSVAPQVREVYDAYASLCTRENMLHALSYSEFRDVMGNLETMSLLSAADGRDGSFAQVTTPSRKGRGSGFVSGGARVEERRVHGTAGVDELKRMVEGLEGARGVLTRMLEGRDL